MEQEINRFVGDGIYHREPVYEAVVNHSPGATLIVPPRKDAVLSSCANAVPSQRDRHIHRIKEIRCSKWKRESSYYDQSHAENAIYRYKNVSVGRLRAKNDEAQKREVEIGCAILNRMRIMGRPRSFPES